MPRPKAGALLGTVLLFAGCNAVLGISDDPVVSAAAPSCDDNSDCVAPQICRFQICVDPEPTAGNGGGVGVGGQESSAGGAQGDGGNGGSGAQPTLPGTGDPCDDEGAVACAANASAERVACVDGEYAAHDACGEGELCDSSLASSGSCAPVVAACQGREPLEAFCEGSVRSVCGPDLVTIQQTTCDSVQLCNYGSGANCAVCLPNEYKCSGEILQVCNTDHTGFDDEQTCMDEPCNAEAGACTIYACTMAGFQKCDANNNLVECASDRMSFTLVEECGGGICDPEALECDVCSPGATRCESGSAFECSSDGQDETSTPCDGDTPHCAGGACVECTGDAHCEPPDDCHTAYCNIGSGECVATPKGEGAVCNVTGVCNATADCVECLDTADHCDEATEVCRLGVCEDAIHTVGWEASTSSTSGVLKDTLYLKKIDVTTSGALLAFGVVGHVATGSAKMVLYADNGAGTAPTGSALAITQSAIPLDALALEVNSSPLNYQLTAGTYWLGINFSANTTIKAGTLTPPGESIADFYTNPTFPSFAGTTIAGSFNTELAIYIRVKAAE